MDSASLLRGMTLIFYRGRAKRGQRFTVSSGSWTQFLIVSVKWNEEIWRVQTTTSFHTTWIFALISHQLFSVNCKKAIHKGSELLIPLPKNHFGVWNERKTRNLVYRTSFIHVNLDRNKRSKRTLHEIKQVIGPKLQSIWEQILVQVTSHGRNFASNRLHFSQHVMRTSSAVRLLSVFSLFRSQYDVTCVSIAKADSKKRQMNLYKYVHISTYTYT